MAKKALTDNAIKKLKRPAKGQVERFDATLPGFAVRVSYGGAKSFVFLYRFEGELRRETLGRYTPGPEAADGKKLLTLAQARARARDIVAAVTEGRDPRNDEAARAIEASRARADTYEQAVDEFIEKFAKAKRGNRTWRWQQLNLMNADKRWHALPVSSITRSDIHDALDKQMARGVPYMANRTHAALNTFFRWLYSRDRIPENPMDRVPRPFDGEKPRVRVWTDDELTAIWKSADELDGFLGPYLRLLLLMGQRRNEVAGMRWDELDLDEAVWTLPHDRHKAGHKTGRDHRFPLPRLAVRIIKSLPSVTGSPLLFPGRSARQGNSRPMTVSATMQRRIQQVSGVKDFTFHDARRTFRTGLDRLDVPPHVKDECLNHARRGVGDTHYSRYDYLDEQRLAFEAWAAHIEGLVHPEGVTGLRG